MFPPFRTGGMSGPSFFQTRMGQIFFEGTMPRLYRAIDRVADLLTERGQYKVVAVAGEIEEIQGTLDELSEDGWKLLHVEGGRMFFQRAVPSKEEG